ncbi:hypothetical protein DXT98_01435 [Agrobacterium sp. ICMP 7243]|nr:hypothetical protein DXT98_01435 [Agrobacterium sp. ICMP 7243]
MSNFTVIVGLCATTAFFASGGYTLLPSSTIDTARSFVDPRCNIKGNISFNSQQKIYHVPGQEYYSETIIRLENGERWFCSEDEARAAGWRKSKL